MLLDVATTITERPADAVPLLEAIQRFVPSELLTEYEQAIARRRQFPRYAAFRPAVFDDEWETHVLNSRSKQTLLAQAEVDHAWARIIHAFKSLLLEGVLIAYAQTDPFGGLRLIPTETWRILRITNVRSGRAKAGNVDLFGIVVAPRPKTAAVVPASGDQRREKLHPDVLQLAIVPGTKEVLVRGVVRLGAADSSLIRTLQPLHTQDIERGRAPENHQYVNSHALADQLNVDEPSVRQRISRCRSVLQEAYLRKFGLTPDPDLLVENKPHKGYRLNPRIRFVAFEELRSDGPTS